MRRFCGFLVGFNTIYSQQSKEFRSNNLNLTWNESNLYTKKNLRVSENGEDYDKSWDLGFKMLIQPQVFITTNKHVEF